MISLTERTILDKRTLGCICDHGTTECKDIISLCDAHRGYCGVYVCNKGLQEILRLTALNDAMNCYCERSEAIQFLNRWILQSDIVKMLKQVQHDDWVCSRIENVGQAMPDGFSGLPRHCVARNDGATTRFFGLRPLNDGMDCNDAFCHPEFISGSIQGGSLQFNTYKMLKQVQHDYWACNMIRKEVA